MTERREVPEMPRTDPDSRSERRTPTVILAEDDDAMRAMLVEWSRSIDCTVIECGSGAELIDQLFRMPVPHLARIGAIVTDERMPGFNGLEALEMLWFMPLPPILLITAYGDDRVVDRAHALGGVDVLPKPFDRNAFVDSLNAILASSVKPRSQVEPRVSPHTR